MGMNDIHSLSHTKWNCKYHIVFAPKYRRKVFYKEKRVAVGKILRQLCEWKGVNIIEAEVCPDHIHMLVEIPPKMAISTFMGYLKGKSSTMLYEQFGELKYKYRSREFWCKGYYVDTAGKNTSRIAEYIKKQLQEDQLGDQLTIPGYSPFDKKKQLNTRLADRITRSTRCEEQRAMPANEQPPATPVAVFFIASGGKQTETFCVVIDSTIPPMVQFS